MSDMAVTEGIKKGEIVLLDLDEYRKTGQLNDFFYEHSELKCRVIGFNDLGEIQVESVRHFNSEGTMKKASGYIPAKYIKEIECSCGSEKLYHDKRGEYFCPSCEGGGGK